MSEEVVQWLSEIRSLKQQLAETQQERDAAQVSTDHWRSLYNTEARQRRTDIQQAQETIVDLQKTVAQLQEITPPPPRDQPKVAAFAAELAPLKTEAQLRNKLIEALYERDRARETLKQEQENHRQTRQNLTAVIGDTMDQLTRLRGKPMLSGITAPEIDPRPQVESPSSPSIPAQRSTVDVTNHSDLDELETPPPQ